MPPSPAASFSPGQLRTAAFLGLALGLVLISTFVFGVDHPNPDWGAYWRVRPLIVTPLVGAAAAAIAYLTFQVLSDRQWPRPLIWLICLAGLLIALWLGTILGLAGTLWN